MASNFGYRRNKARSRAEKAQSEAAIDLALSRFGRSLKDELWSNIIRGSLLSILFSAMMFALGAVWMFRLPAAKFLWLLCPLLIVLYVLLRKRLTAAAFFQRQMKARPDDDLAQIVAPYTGRMLPRFWARLADGLIMLAALLAFGLLFSVPRYFYEPAPEGVRLRVYTEGLWQKDKTVTLPAFYQDEKVTGIRERAFGGISTLEEVCLPDTLQELGEAAFKDCSALERVEIPPAAEILGKEMFKNCRSLREVKLHDGIIAIGEGCFAGCTSLEAIALPPEISEIAEGVFEDCRMLERVELPEDLRRIREAAFKNCVSLREIELPDTLLAIGPEAFFGCRSLGGLVLPQGCETDPGAFLESSAEIVYR